MFDVTVSLTKDTKETPRLFSASSFTYYKVKRIRSHTKRKTFQFNILFLMRRFNKFNYKLRFYRVVCVKRDVYFVCIEYVYQSFKLSRRSVYASISYAQYQFRKTKSDEI